MTTDSRWPPMPNPFSDYDDPASVRLVDTPNGRPKTSEEKPDDGARLGKPWERTKRDALERALVAARCMADDVEVFVGELSIANPGMAGEYEALFEEADARIRRLEKLGEHL